MKPRTHVTACSLFGKLVASAKLELTRTRRSTAVALLRRFVTVRDSSADGTAINVANGRSGQRDDGYRVNLRCNERR